MPHVFLSYCRENLNEMVQVKRHLEKRGIEIWVDLQMPLGTRILPMEIERKIETCSCMIVLLTPLARKSEWIGMETYYARQLEKRIIPVLFDGEPQDSIPIQLSLVNRVDLRFNYDAEINRLADQILSEFGDVNSVDEIFDDDVIDDDIIDDAPSPDEILDELDEDAPPADQNAVEWIDVGFVTQYIKKPRTAVIELNDSVEMGDLLRIGEESDGFEQRVDMVEVNGGSATDAVEGEIIHLPIDLKTSVDTVVYKATNVDIALVVGTVVRYDQANQEMVIRLSADFRTGDSFGYREGDNRTYTIKVLPKIETDGGHRTHMKENEELILRVQGRVPPDRFVYRIEK